MKNIIVLALSLFIQACTSYSTKEEYEAALDLTAVKRERISDLKYQKLDIESVNKFELGDDGEAFDFGAGKTFYKAFKLPADSGEYTHIEVRSGFNTVAQAFGHVPYPRIMLLDESHNIALDKYSEMKQASDWDGDVEFKDEIALNPEAKYLVLFTSPDTLDGSIMWNYSMVLPVGGAFVPFGSKKGAKIGVGGPIKIKFLKK